MGLLCWKVSKRERQRSLGNSSSGSYQGSEVVALRWSNIKMGLQVGHGQVFDVFKSSWAGTRVAVKLLRPEHCVNTKLLRDIKEEALVQMEMKHKYIARTYGAITENPSQPCIVMHYYRGGSLADLMQRPRGIGALAYEDIEQTYRLRMCTQVAKGLQFLAAHDIVHGSLTVHNILVDHDTTRNAHKSCQVAIGHLGQYRPLHKLSSAATASCSVGGSGDDTARAACDPRTTPPERILNPKLPKDTSQDVYAFAYVLLEILMGGLVWKDPLALTEAELRAMAQGQRPPIPPVVPPNIAEIIRQCWAQNPKDRPGVKKLVEQLELGERTLALTESSHVHKADTTAGTRSTLHTLPRNTNTMGSSLPMSP